MQSGFLALGLGPGHTPLPSSLLKETCENFYHLLGIGASLWDLVQIIRDADLAFLNNVIKFITKLNKVI